MVTSVVSLASNMKRMSTTACSLASESGYDDLCQAKRFSGAASYKTKFQGKWKEKQPFITPVKGNEHLFHCTVC